MSREKLAALVSGFDPPSARGVPRKKVVPAKPATRVLTPKVAQPRITLIGGRGSWDRIERIADMHGPR